LTNIKDTGAENVVLMTDGDMNGDARYGETLVLPGVVWFVWRLDSYYHTGSEEIVKHLRGQQGIRQFAFNTSKN